MKLVVWILLDYQKNIYTGMFITERIKNKQANAFVDKRNSDGPIPSSLARGVIGL